MKVNTKKQLSHALSSHSIALSTQSTEEESNRKITSFKLLFEVYLGNIPISLEEFLSLKNGHEITFRNHDIFFGYLKFKGEEIMNVKIVIEKEKLKLTIENFSEKNSVNTQHF
jgi:flagellar motor switch protein FliM